MYSIDFELNGKKITKEAQNEQEVRRLVFIYTLGSQAEKEQLIKEILSKKDIDILEQHIKSNKSKKDVNL